MITSVTFLLLMFFTQPSALGAPSQGANSHIGESDKPPYLYEGPHLIPYYDRLYVNEQYNGRYVNERFRALNEAVQSGQLNSITDWALWAALIHHESGNRNLESVKGAAGPGQIMPKTWLVYCGEYHIKELRLNPYKNFKCSLKYFFLILPKEIKGDLKIYPWLRIASYNAGPTLVNKRSFEFNALPAETRQYYQRVSNTAISILQNYVENRRRHHNPTARGKEQ